MSYSNYNVSSLLPGIGVAVGRFQTHELHAGHLEVIASVNRHQKGIVFIGCAATPVTKPNPMDFITRKLMLQEVVGENVTILPIYDHPSDEAWSKQLNKAIREIAPFGQVTMYHSRDSFKDRYHGNYSLQEVPAVGNLNATEIRNAVGATPINSVDFRSGVIYASQNMYPRVQPTVDVIVYSNDIGGTKSVLLGRKPGKKSYCFVGGFVDMADETAMDAAVRELREETTLVANPYALEWLTTCKINDWRDTTSTSVMTTCFQVAIDSCNGTAVAADDIEEVRWFVANDQLFDQLGKGHHVLFHAFLDRVSDKKL